MTDADFLDLAERALRRVESECDRISETSEVDIDSRRSGSVVTLILGDGSQIVVNLQKPLHEIWLAAKSGGYHFRHDGQVWQDTRGQGELFAVLTACARHQTGTNLTFYG